MGGKEELEALRKRIDEIDRQLIPLFKERMEISVKVAEVKAKHALPVLDENREREVIERAAAQAGDENKEEVALLMRTIMSLSRARQKKSVCAREAEAIQYY